MTEAVRNIVSMSTLASGHVRVLCVDEHLRYVNFVIPRRLSTLEDATPIMHAVLDARAHREDWKRNGTDI